MKIRPLTTLALLIAAWLAAPASASAGELLREFSGSSSTTTPSFQVRGPWTLDWHLAGDYENLIALDITLVDATTGRHVGRVLHTKQKGKGLKLFREPGTYQLRISTTLGRWRVKITQLDDEEVERYTPKERLRPGPKM